MFSIAIVTLTPNTPNNTLSLSGFQGGRGDNDFIALLARICYIDDVVNELMIIFTAHALLKLGHRGITKSLVARVVMHPDEILPGRDGRQIAIKEIAGKKLKVVFVRKGKHILIITQYYKD